MVCKIMRRSTNSNLIQTLFFCVILEYTICTTFHLQQSKSNILKDKKKMKRKRVKETKEVREYGHSIREKREKIT